MSNKDLMKTHKHKWSKLEGTAIDNYTEQCKGCGEYYYNLLKELKI